MDKESVLIPTSVDAKDLDSMRYHTLKVEEVLSRMSREGTALNLLVLDACREDTPTGSKGQTKGLGRIEHKPTGSLVLYSTAMGQTAKDSRLFNQVVLEKLGSAKYILNVANDISKSVYNQSGYKQKPEVLSSLVPDIRLGGGGYVPPSPPTTAQIVTSKWITSNIKIATWQKAKKICREHGARLPTREELKKVVRDCGGINTTYGDNNWNTITNKNMANKSYQSCYKKKGFTSSVYWSSTTSVSDSSYAWVVSFYYGDDNWGSKTFEGYVRCVRGGQ